jgi:competence ComEA-like helix-hairpin-helix protein
LKNLFKDYFNFSKSEKKGIIFTLILITLSILINFYSKNLFQPKQKDFSEFFNQVDSLTTKNSIPIPSEVNQIKIDPNNLNKEQAKKAGIPDKVFYNIKNYIAKGGTFKHKEDVKKFLKNDNLYQSIESLIEIKKIQQSSEIFYFNPNNLTKEKWMLLGLNEWQYRTIQNFEQKGGRFYKKNDLKKIYGIDSALFKKWSPYIIIPNQKKSYYSLLLDTTNNNQIDSVFTIAIFPDKLFIYQQISKSKIIEKQKIISQKNIISAAVFIQNDSIIPANNIIDFDNYSPVLKAKFEKQKINININIADSSELVRLSGVGPSFASRIIKYREKLGGFYQIKQLQEVYGLDEQKIKTFESQIIFDTTYIRKININHADFKQLTNHPYIDKNIATSLINYKKQHGNFQKIQDIKKSNLVNEELYSKIAPYLSTE